MTHYTSHSSVPFPADRLRIGLIGNPIGHSQSPALFREYFADRPDILQHWSYDLIERDSFPDAYAAFLRDYVAVNVTTPFKEEAFRAADTWDYSALRCQASNLMVFRAADTWDYSALRCQASNLMVKTSIRDTCAPQPIENATLRQAESGIARFNGKKQSATGNILSPESAFRIMAYNTDFEAVLEILRQECPKPGGCRVLIIGCGGAGKAATAAAIEAGMQTRIYNRTISRPREFAEYLRMYNPHACSAVPQIVGLDSIEMPIAAQSVVTQSVAEELQTAIRDSDAIIYTISGLSDPIQHLLTAHPDILSDKTVIEANYKAPVLASVSCRRYISGLTWLRLQAIATYLIVLGPSCCGESVVFPKGRLSK